MFKTKKSKIIGAIILIAIVIIAAFSIIYVTKYMTPKAKIKIGIENLIKNLNKNSSSEKISNTLYKIAENPIGTTTTLSINSNLNDEFPQQVKDFEEIVNDISIKNTIKTNNEKELQTETLLSYKESKVVNLKSYIEDEKVYLFLDGLFTKYIKVDAENIQTLLTSNDINSDDINYLRDEILKSISKNLKDEYISTSKEKVNFDKEVSLDKYTLDVDKMVKDGFIEEVIATTLENDKALETIKKLINDEKYSTKSEILDYYKTNLEELKEKISADIEFSIYTKGFFAKTVMYELNIVSEENSNEDKLSANIKYITYDTENYNEKLTVKLEGFENYYEEQTGSTSVDIDLNNIVIEILSKNEEDNYDITVNLNDNQIVKAKGTIDEASTNLEYEMDLERFVSGLKLNGKIISNIEITNDSIKRTGSISIENESFGSVTLNYDAETKNTTMSNRSKFYNEIEIDEITQIDLNNIYTKLGQTKLFADVLSVISSNIGNEF